MALVPLLTLSTSTDGLQTYITDSTVYGGANPARNTYGVYLSAYKVDSGLIETALTTTAFIPTTASIFYTTNTVDGRYKFYYVIVPNWLIGTTYSKYNLVWDAITNSFYEYNNATPSAGNAVTDINYWTVVLNPTTKIQNVGTALDPLNISYIVKENIADYLAAKCYATAATLTAKEDCGEAGDCGCSSKLGKSTARIRVLLTVMQISNIRQQYSEGEKAARLAETYCSDCGCLER